MYNRCTYFKLSSEPISTIFGHEKIYSGARGQIHIFHNFKTPPTQLNSPISREFIPCMNSFFDELSFDMYLAYNMSHICRKNAK